MSSRSCGRPAALASGLLTVVVLTTGCTAQVAGVPAGPQPPSTTVTTPTPTPPRAVSPQRVGPRTLSRLPRATTFGKVPGAPRDGSPNARPSGLVVHPKRLVPVYSAPGGRPIAALPATQLGAPTWLPVIQRRSGWLRVLLPARPNGATGWLHDDHLELARNRHWITVDRKRFRLTWHRPGRSSRSWTVGVGKRSAVTPAGRTFLLANVYDAGSKFSTIVLPLGAHSDTFTTYGGGPGTVGIHTWPTSDVFGKATSDGCIRIPRAALRLLSRNVPLGTPVLVR